MKELSRSTAHGAGRDESTLRRDDMKFTFGSWNLNNRSLHSGHIHLLRTVDCDLLAVQEATDRFHSELSKANLFDWSVSSLTLRPPGADEGRARRHGCRFLAVVRFDLIPADSSRRCTFPNARWS